MINPFMGRNLLRSWGRRLVIILLVLIVLKCGWNLFWVLQKEVLYPSYGYRDHALFMGMGRALLNGLTPYVDIFENKPPGIFLVAAFSLWFDNDITLARFAQVAALAAIPITMCMAALPILRDCSPRTWIIGSTCAFIFGSILMLFTASLAGGFYTESFGAAFGVGYAALTVKRTWHRSDTFWASLLILATLGFKEPFLFALIAISLISNNSLREWYRRFAIPLGIALLLGTVLLALLGFLNAYVGTYLHYLIFDHRFLISQMGVGNFSAIEWIKSMNVVPFLPATVLLLIAMLFLPDKKDIDRPARQRFLRIAAALLCTIIANQIAGYDGHQQVVGMPIYAAMFLAVLTTCVAWQRHRLVQIMGTIFVSSMVVSTLLFPTPSLAEWVLTERQKESQIKALAQSIDSILDACEIERYLRLSVSNEQEFAYMRHSPLPVGLIPDSITTKLPVPLFRKQLRESLEVAQIILIRDGAILTPEIGQYLEKNFTYKSPDCAGKPELPVNLTVLFRKTGMSH